MRLVVFQTSELSISSLRFQDLDDLSKTYQIMDTYITRYFGNIDYCYISTSPSSIKLIYLFLQIELLTPVEGVTYYIEISISFYRILITSNNFKFISISQMLDLKNLPLQSLIKHKAGKLLHFPKC